MNMFSLSHLSSFYERNQEATLYIGNIDQRVDESILWELFIQCGPVISVHIPRDKITSENQGFGFLEFRNEDDCDYALKIMNMIKLFGKPLRLSKASQDKRSQEIGANLFIGNISENTDEKTLRDVFSAFGNIITLKFGKESEKSKKHAFINYDTFEASDNAIKLINGQYVSGKILKVEYALRPGSKTERYGSLAERILAANRPNFSNSNNVY